MFACIHIPDFSVQASLLPEPAEVRLALNHSPIAVLDGPANLPRVFATNPAARRAGIQIGMTKLQAEVCHGVALRKRSLAEEESAQAALLACAGAFSPRVESTGAGDAILDLNGTEKLWGIEKLFHLQSSDQEKSSRRKEWQYSPWAPAVRVMTAHAAATGFDVRIAIAVNPDTAFLAARGFPESTIIPAGQETCRLASLRVNVFPVLPEMLETLDHWGIRTFQSLAALPPVAVVERLGQAGLHLQKLARGAIIRPLLTIEPDADFSASFEFDDPVETLESIFFILKRLVQQLSSRLISISQAASELRLTIGLNVRQLASLYSRDGHEHQRAQAQSAAIVSEPPSSEPQDLSVHVWKLPVPTQDKNVLFSLIRLHLEKVTFSAPVRCLQIEIVPVKPRLAQGNLFLPPSPEPEKLEITLERIRGVVGATDSDGICCVGAPHLLDTHKPASFTLQNFSTLQDVEDSSHRERGRPIRKTNRSAGSKLKRYAAFVPRAEIPSAVEGYFSSSPPIALRVFRPALETRVELDEDKPHFVRLWNHHRRVVAASGPWTTSGNWWNASRWFREEWDVVLKTSDGLGFYRIYRDRLRGQWFVEGVFD